jgi:hypothetical protein
MNFLEPFVNNEDYSFEEIIKNIAAIQQYAVENKDNPLPNLKEKWLYANDDEYLEIINETRRWIKDNRVAISEYPNILMAINSDFFIEKMNMLCNADDYLGQIVMFMKTNVSKASIDELNDSLYDSFQDLPERDGKGHIQQLKTEMGALREKKFKQEFDCDSIFGSRDADIYKRLNGLATKGKDILDVCPPGMIVDRIRQEENLQAIDNARGILLGFYRSNYPINMSKEERCKKLQENKKSKALIDELNEYLETGNMTKSKRFMIRTMIKSIDGTLL